MYTAVNQKNEIDVYTILLYSLVVCHVRNVLGHYIPALVKANNHIHEA